MRSTILRLAESIMTKPINLREAYATLLPPKPLYRSLLRAHRSLPQDLREMGDSYVKSEFRLHKSTTNPVHIIGFLSQWKLYLDTLPETNYGGKKLDAVVFEKMSPEQLGQLYELMQAAKDVYKPLEGGDSTSTKA